MAEAAKFVDDCIEKSKVVVFSKSYCPFCTKAKGALNNHSPSGMVVVELDGHPDMEAIQNYLGEKTGARSVPRVFIDKKFVGDGDEIASKEKSGELALLLKQCGSI